MSMKSIKVFAAAACLAAGSVFAGAAAAQEAETAVAAASEKAAPVILIVDQARVIAESKAGNSIAEQMKLLQDTANKELEKEIAKITKEAETLKGKKGDLGEQEYIKKAQALALKQNNLPVLREIKVQELSVAEQNAIAVIGEEMRPILKEIVDSRGATLLLDRSAVMYAAKATDITEEVLVNLDKKLTTVKVERVSLVKSGE